MVGKSSDEKLALKVSKLKAELKNLREQLRKSEEKYKDIIENIEDGCGECDLAGNFTFTNTALRNILGYSKDELLGMNYRKYMLTKPTE
jgi:PAS domain-containing protein